MVTYTLMNTAQFETIEGKKPILFSAPHACLHRRPKLSMAYRQPEMFTDTIVREICALTGAWGIVLVSDIDYDPNFRDLERNEFKKAVKEICKENSIKQFVDIHGMAKGSDFDLGIFFPTRFQKSKAFADLVRENIGIDALYGINTSLFRFLDNEEETLGEFVAEKMKIPAIQIEIARYIREDEKLRESFVRNLSKLINERFV